MESILPDSFKNIIFDFGGVVCNIDFTRTEQKFLDLGVRSVNEMLSMFQTGSIYEKLEQGLISPDKFRTTLRPLFIRPVSDQQLDEAWNALLLDIPEPRMRLLERLRTSHRIFLLSNSNEIHYQHYLVQLRERYGYVTFDELFEKAYFSFRLKMMKPDPRIFQYVLKDSGLKACETLFIDDSPQHVTGAEMAGITGLNLPKGMDLVSVFDL